ncbi:hypothetical protein SNEBB_009399 [Seison nebaliae]|nr:hypothetical protein SNEBB_009399 [Seison nebaliae]
MDTSYKSIILIIISLLFILGETSEKEKKRTPDDVTQHRIERQSSEKKQLFEESEKVSKSEEEEGKDVKKMLESLRETFKDQLPEKVREQLTNHDGGEETINEEQVDKAAQISQLIMDALPQLQGSILEDGEKLTDANKMEEKKQQSVYTIKQFEKFWNNFNKKLTKEEILSFVVHFTELSQFVDKINEQFKIDRIILSGDMIKCLIVQDETKDISLREIHLKFNDKEIKFTIDDLLMEKNVVKLEEFHVFYSKFLSDQLDKLKEEILRRDRLVVNKFQQVYSNNDVPEGHREKNEVKKEEIIETDENEEKKMKNIKLLKENAERFFENREYRSGYEALWKASELGDKKSKEMIILALLLGDRYDMDIELVKQMVHELAKEGNGRANFILGLFHATGLAGYQLSQAKTLVYYSVGAYAEDEFASMALGYRYLNSISVNGSCELALAFYRRVAVHVARQIHSSLGHSTQIINRVRLLNEEGDTSFWLSKVPGSTANNNVNDASSFISQDLLQYYEVIAERGEVTAQMIVAQLYMQGARGLSINYKKALHYYSLAAEQNMPNALAFIGKMYLEGNHGIERNYNLAFKYLKKAVDNNNMIAQATLGYMYYFGIYVEKDEKEAFALFSKSANQGYGEGQLFLGMMHFNGEGTPKNYKLAEKNFRLACQGGHVLAFHSLGEMYAAGIGVVRHCATAVELFRTVAERGRWGRMFNDAHQQYINGNYASAFMLYTLLGELGYEIAQSNAAYILETFLDRDSSKDKKIFGDYFEITKRQHDVNIHNRTFILWNRAAQQQSVVARIRLGDYYYYGKGTEIDYLSAAAQYKMASEKSFSAQALFNLGYMHLKGIGLAPDIHLAKRFYDRAAEVSSDAYVPVSLALLKLQIDLFLQKYVKYLDIFNQYEIFVIRFRR